MNSSDDFALKLQPNNLPVEQPLNYVSHGGELNLTNLGQMELLLAMSERGVPLRTRVCGFSMHPFIRDRDVLTIAPISNRPPRVGEVVAFSHPVSCRLVIHRITAIKGSRWLMRGDNSPVADGLVRTGAILGRVVRVERQGKEVRLGFRVGIGSFLIARLSLCNLLSPIMKLASFTLSVIPALRNLRS
jgi:hypothetical protein